MKISFKTTGRQRRDGLSLIEVLVALSMTLIVLVAMTQAFKFASGEMTKGRASVELINKLRVVEDLLRSDLRSLTVDVVPHHNLSSEPKGYFEITDGRAVDVNYIPNQFGVLPTAVNVQRSILNLAMGDYDDIIAGTIKSSSVPFRGRNGGGAEESSLAEVIWFTVPNDLDGDNFVDATERVTLYRRLLIIKPSLGMLIPEPVTTPAGIYANETAATNALIVFLENNDISARVQFVTGTGWVVFANSLESLTDRGNRFFAAAQGLPIPGTVYRAALLVRRSTDQQDIIMSDVAAFDVKVFDPTEPIATTTLIGGEAFTTASDSDLNLISTQASGAAFSGEAGYTSLNIGGTFVDLGKGSGVGVLGLRPFGYNLPALGYPAAAFGISPRQNFVDVYYDTGTIGYERNNADDGDPTGNSGLIDEGGDGIDNDGDGEVDEIASWPDTDGDGVFEAGEVDLGEREIPAPYNVGIRGIKISVRGIEPLTNQVSQVTVEESFLGE